MSTSPPILLIEDCEDDYEATSRAFGRAGLDNPIVWARSGREGLSMLAGPDARAFSPYAPLPAMILLDLNMPGLSGRQILGTLKQDAMLKHIPVIILTTSADDRDIEECYRLGANTYVQKPVTFDAMIAAVRRLGDYWFEIALLPGRRQA